MICSCRSASVFRTLVLLTLLLLRATQAVTRTTAYYYNRAGDVVRKTISPETAFPLQNGQFTRNVYDGRGHLTDLQTLDATGGGAQRIVSSDSVYLHSGAVATVHEYRGTGGSPLRTITNVYDRAWRLLKETDTPASGPVTVTNFGYDKANNRTSLVRTLGGTTVNNTTCSYYATL